MNDQPTFTNRRNKKNRRVDPDPCENMSLDLYHRKRRKSGERRDVNRTLEDDYQAVVDNDPKPNTTTTKESKVH